MEKQKADKTPKSQSKFQQMPASTAKRFSQEECQRRLDMRALSRPIQQQADILQYFHHWRSRIPDNIKTYSRLAPQERNEVMRKLHICHQYGQRYLQPYLALWYSYLIRHIKKAHPFQPQITISQSELERIFAQIYKTHKEPQKQLLRIPKQLEVSQTKPNESKTFLNKFMTNIITFFSKREDYHGPEPPTITKKI